MASRIISSSSGATGSANCADQSSDPRILSLLRVALSVKSSCFENLVLLFVSSDRKNAEAMSASKFRLGCSSYAAASVLVHTSLVYHGLASVSYFTDHLN